GKTSVISHSKRGAEFPRSRTQRAFRFGKDPRAAVDRKGDASRPVELRPSDQLSAGVVQSRQVARSPDCDENALMVPAAFPVFFKNRSTAFLNGVCHSGRTEQCV